MIIETIRQYLNKHWYSWKPEVVEYSKGIILVYEDVVRLISYNTLMLRDANIDHFLDEVLQQMHKEWSTGRGR